MYKVILCGLAFTGYKGGRRRWTDPASGKVMSSKNAARLADKWITVEYVGEKNGSEFILGTTDLVNQI
jgi:hypothetical protein